MRRVTETFASPNEVYPTLEQACYLKYLCAWCQEKYFLVEPETHRAGGGIIHEKVNGYETGSGSSGAGGSGGIHGSCP
jgi:hypothetical protein